MKKADIIIFYDVVARELDVFSNVKAYLEKSLKCRVEVFSQKYDRKHVLDVYEEPKIVCSPSIFLDKGKIYEVIQAWPNARYVSFNFEQFFRNVEIPGRKPRGDFSINEVTHLSWGGFFDQFLTASGVPEGNIKRVGNPVFNLYKEPYSEFYPDKAALGQRWGLDPNKLWVFVPENYTAAFYTEKDIDKFLSRGLKRDEIMDNVQFSADALKEAIKWWKACADNDQYELIVRPKPINPKEIFVSLLSDENDRLKSNIHVLKEGSCREWVLASDVTVSSYSTVLMEAAMAGKSCLMMQSTAPNEAIKSEWHQHVPVVRIQEEFLDALSSIRQSGVNNSRLLDWIEENLYDCNKSLEESCKVIEGVYQGCMSISSSERSNVSIKRNLVALLSLLRFYFGGFLARFRRTSKPDTRSLDLLGKTIRFQYDYADNVDRKTIANTTDLWKKFRS